MTRSSAIDDAAVLARNPWFADLPATLRDDFLAQAEMREMPAGRWVYGTGDAPRGLYVVLAGTALVYVPLQRGDDALVHVALPGEVFGHAARLGRGPRLATILTARPSRLLYLSEPALAALAHRHPDTWEHLTRLLYEQLGATLLALAESIALPARARLASRLLVLSGTGETPSAVELPQALIAELVGVSRKTVNALLAELVAQGCIELGYRSIRIVDVERLQVLRRDGDGH